MPMSHVFQTTPPSVYTHILPRRASFFSYRVQDSLSISAWMPDNFATVEQDIIMTNDGFYREYCQDCERNCYQFLQEYTDENDEVDWDSIPNGHCHVYDDGYSGQTCPEGHEKEEVSMKLDLSDMVFTIKLNDSFPNFLEKVGDTAYLASGYVDESGKIWKTRNLQASNVFGTNLHPDGVCWGRTHVPTTLREIVTNYVSTPFNNDLLKLDAFENNCDILREEKSLDEFSICDACNDHKFLCNGDEADALIVVHAENNIPAFFTFLSAGFKSLEELPHIMLIPAKEAVVTNNGSTYEGYLTIPDAVGMMWFVSKDNQVVGQFK